MQNESCIQGIGQIAVAVSDIERAKGFYGDTLGLPLLFEAPPALAFFDCGGVRLMLTTQQGDEADHKTSVIYYKVADIQAATDTLKSRGVAFVREPAMTAQLADHELWIGFVRDPDGTLVGIMAEVPYKNVT
jgi:catechol 2,3-dioxygenase-like lactoylglutathione lyase family enzyme